MTVAKPGASNPDSSLRSTLSSGLIRNPSPRKRLNFLKGQNRKRYLSELGNLVVTHPCSRVATLPFTLVFPNESTNHIEIDRYRDPRYFGQADVVTCQQCRITKVTFTLRGRGRTIQSWFGSSGGGLPRRPELTFRTLFVFGPLAQATPGFFGAGLTLWPARLSSVLLAAGTVSASPRVQSPERGAPPFCTPLSLSRI